MAANGEPLTVTAITASAQLGGTERVLLDFANRAFEFDVALRVLTPRDGPLVEILNDIGVPTEVVPAPPALLRASQQHGRLASLVGAVVGLPLWSRRLTRHRHFREADVIYTVGYKPHLAVALARRHPVVWHLHEFPPAVTGGIWRFLARRIPDALIANSEAAGKAWMSSAGSGRVEAIPNGVNLDRFKPAQRTFWIHDELGVPHEHRLVGMPAVFARWKGQLEVMEAFREIAPEFPGVHLVIVGGSIYDTVAEREYGIELTKATRQSIHILPFQSKIERVYPEFDITIHYSLRPEPFGRVIVESMACGVPVIAAAEGGPLEIVGEGIGPRREAGWLAEPRNPAALAAILRSALSLPGDVLRSVGEAGRRRAEDHYSARRFAREVAGVLRETVRGDARRVEGEA